MSKNIQGHPFLLRLLADLEDLAEQFSALQSKIMAALDDLTAQVTDNETVEASAVALINGIAARITAAGTDPAKLAALTASLKTSRDVLAAAIVANTPVITTLPAITAIADQSIVHDTATAALPFTVGSPTVAASALHTSANSSNTTLVPDLNIVLAGTDAVRTVTITPAVGQTGTSTITLSVSDGAAVTTSFVLTVT